MIRCNNCGTLGHFPKHCPNYGFYYPAPGKTREDYEEDRQRVQDLFAADIIREHEPHEDDDYAYVFDGARLTAEEKARLMEVGCPLCQVEPGQRCVTEAGKYAADPHKARVKALDPGPPGM